MCVPQVRVLISGGAAIDAADKFGSTALHYAAKSNHLPICEILVAAGAEHSIPNKHGKTPIDLGRGDSNVVVFLEMLSKAEDAFVENAQDEVEEAKALEREAEEAGIFGGRYERLGHKGEAGGAASREAAAAVLLQSHARGHFSRKQELAKAKAMAALAQKSAEEKAILILQVCVSLPLLLIAPPLLHPRNFSLSLTHTHIHTIIIVSSRCTLSLLLSPSPTAHLLCCRLPCYRSQAYARGYKARRQHRARTKDVVKAEEEEMRRHSRSERVEPVTCLTAGLNACYPMLAIACNACYSLLWLRAMACYGFEL